MDNSRDRIIQLEAELKVRKEYDEKRDTLWDTNFSEIQKTISGIKSSMDTHNRLLENKFNEALKEFRIELKGYVHKDNFNENGFVKVETFKPIHSTVERYEADRRRVLYAILGIIGLGLIKLIWK